MVAASWAATGRTPSVACPRIARRSCCPVTMILARRRALAACVGRRCGSRPGGVGCGCGLDAGYFAGELARVAFFACAEFAIGANASRSTWTALRSLSLTTDRAGAAEAFLLVRRAVWTSPRPRPIPARGVAAPTHGRLGSTDSPQHRDSTADWAPAMATPKPAPSDPTNTEINSTGYSRNRIRLLSHEAGGALTGV